MTTKADPIYSIPNPSYLTPEQRRMRASFEFTEQPQEYADLHLRPAIQNDPSLQRLRETQAAVHRGDLEALFDEPASREQSVRAQKAMYILQEGDLLDKYRNEKIGV